MSKLQAAAGGGSLVRFLASGGVNTVLSWLLYTLLLQVLPYRISYTIAYVFGIALAYVLYRFYVFGRSAGKLGPVWVSLIYVLQYGLGLALVSLWVQVFDGPAIVAPLFAVALSLPLTYSLNRWVFRERKARVPDVTPQSNR